MTILAGIARALNSEVLRDPITHKPCVWYHFETEERKRWGKNSDWRVTDSATSARPFVLDDGTALRAIMTLQATIDGRKPEVIVGDLLRSWKTNRQALIARFDADGSGHIEPSQRIE